MSAFVLFQPKQQQKSVYNAVRISYVLNGLCFQTYIHNSSFITTRSLGTRKLHQIYGKYMILNRIQLTHKFPISLFVICLMSIACAPVANPLYWAKNSIKYACFCVKFIILNPSTAQMVADSTNKSSLVSHLP